MARTLEDIRASRPAVDHAKLDATTEEDIRRYAAEDDSEPAAPLSEFKRRPGQRGKGRRPAMVALNVRVSPDTLDAFKLAGESWRQAVRRALDDAAFALRKTAGSDDLHEAGARVANVEGKTRSVSRPLPHRRGRPKKSAV